MAARTCLEDRSSGWRIARALLRDPKVLILGKFTRITGGEF